MTTQASSPISVAAPRTYKILVAVAFESTGDVAMEQGIGLAVGNSASELHVVHAVEEPGGLTSDALPDTARRLQQATNRLRERVESAWQQSGELQVIAHIRPGEPGGVVLQAAVDIDADVIVVGSHRRTGLRKLVLGSVAERVLHGAHCPVFIAVPKDYMGTTASPQIEPPCAECLSIRKQSANARFWCERHSKPYLQPHVYVPRDQARSSVLSTY